MLLQISTANFSFKTSHHFHGDMENGEGKSRCWSIQSDQFHIGNNKELNIKILILIQKILIFSKYKFFKFESMAMLNGKETVNIWKLCTIGKRAYIIFWPNVAILALFLTKIYIQKMTTKKNFWAVFFHFQCDSCFFKLFCQASKADEQLNMHRCVSSSIFGKVLQL